MNNLYFKYQICPIEFRHLNTFLQFRLLYHKPHCTPLTVPIPKQRNSYSSFTTAHQQPRLQSLQPNSSVTNASLLPCRNPTVSLTPGLSLPNTHAKYHPCLISAPLRKKENIHKRTYPRFPSKPHPSFTPGPSHFPTKPHPS